MSFKLLILTVVMLVFNSGCSVFERVVYRPEINQGNYLKITDITNIYPGMTKQQVVYILSMPMLRDPFGSNTWYYIFRREYDHGAVYQKTLTLTFNNSDILTNIEKLTFKDAIHSN